MTRDDLKIGRKYKRKSSDKIRIITNIEEDFVIAATINVNDSLGAKLSINYFMVYYEPIADKKQIEELIKALEL